MPVTAPAYIDHHCHGIVTDELDRRRLESLFSESHRPHDGGGSQFDKPLGLMIRRHCAPALGLEPLAMPRPMSRAVSSWVPPKLIAA